jgi:hypothetical protein
MRQLFIILVIAALGYFGWDYYQNHQDSLSSSIPFLKKSDAAGTSSNPAAPGAPVPAPAPQFVSKVQVPEASAGQKPAAPPGFFYMLDRVSVETASGVTAVVPGDLVKLLQRKSNGTLRVTINHADFDVKEEQVTQDPEVAMVAEKREFDKRVQHR